MDPMPPGFHFGAPEVQAVLLATAIISTIAAIRYARWWDAPDRVPPGEHCD